MTVIVESKTRSLELVIAQLVSKHFHGDKVGRQTTEAIKVIFKSAYSIMEEHGNIVPEDFLPSPKLTFSQLVPFTLYKNVNTYDDQFYMKVYIGGKERLITGSSYSNYSFQTSSATQTGEVFVDFKTKLNKR